MKQKLCCVCRDFGIRGRFLSYTEISIGNVNRTYKVDFTTEDGDVISYMVQSLNTVAFKNPVAVMENIDLVTSHIHSKQPELSTLRFCRTAEGTTYLFEGDIFWRVYTFIPSVTYNSTEDPTIVRSTGEAFGHFQLLLSDFDPSLLHETIPHFHDTVNRYEILERDAAADPLGRLSGAQEELRWLLSVRDQACTLITLHQAGTLPLRVTHNDTKINNVLFDPEKKRALAVIDLDTVMPGLIGFDFGDAIRFAANRIAEDCSDCSRAGIDLDVFRCFSEGFLEKTASILAPEEIDTLALSCFVITCEQAVRFLSDYLMGDIYFRTLSPEHNLIRTRCQIALAKDILDNLPKMQAIIQTCAAQYRKS